jgi:anthranilate synthase/aminodeoxychorismate synthase-like glutamine amidotransferase
MIFVLDNYDSFTFNLVQYLGELGAEPVVRRNDRMTPEEVLAMGPEGIVISPGPGVPERAGISVALVRAAARSRVPLLGVCLGHQAIAVAFGARVGRARTLMHGKASLVRHDGTGVLAGIPSPFEAMRYHSLVVEREGLPGSLRVTAWSDDPVGASEVMAMAHEDVPVHGVQFHPESIGTSVGRQILRGFVGLCGLPLAPAAGNA